MKALKNKGKTTLYRNQKNPATSSSEIPPTDLPDTLSERRRLVLGNRNQTAAPAITCTTL